MKALHFFPVVFLAYFGIHTPFASEPQVIQPKVLRVFSHADQGFTQGFFWADSFLYEGTGLNGQSKINKISLRNGEIFQSRKLDKYFGEGITLFNNKIYQLTWKAQKAFVYRLKDFQLLDSLSYSGEGWGLTHDTKFFVMSNGSDTLYYRNERFKIVKKVPVRIGTQPLRMLNELEYVNGKIYANIWYQQIITEIDPLSGLVTRVIDCKLLFDIERPISNDMVLNGIAYDPSKKSFYLTGKKWKNIFEVTWPNP